MDPSKPILLPIVRQRPDPDYTVQELLGNDWGLQMCAEAFAVADLLGVDVKLSENAIGEEDDSLCLHG